MLVLKNNNIAEIVAHMLNFEHNHTTYKVDEEGELCPSEDIKKFPIITTKNGKHLHYKATCGVIYYNKTDSEIYSINIIELIKKLHKIISTKEDHLLTERITAVTGSCVVKQNMFINGTYMIKTQKPFLATKKNVDKFPARALIILPNKYEIDYYNNCPPHYSARASFTWYFMPIQYNLPIHGIGHVNALISSIYLDFEDTTKFNHCDFVTKISYSDCKLVNTINNINYRFLLLGNKNIEQGTLLCVNTHIPYSIMRKNMIKTYDEIECVNNERLCNCCNKDVSDFSIGVVLEFNNIIPIVSLFCLLCSDFYNVRKKKAFFIFSANPVNVIKILPGIYQISQQDFIHSLLGVNVNITEELSKFPPEYNILFADSPIQYIIGNVPNYNQYIIIQIKLDIYFE